MHASSGVILREVLLGTRVILLLFRLSGWDLSAQSCLEERLAINLLHLFHLLLIAEILAGTCLLLPLRCGL
jgi:hypothetical protein